MTPVDAGRSPAEEPPALWQRIAPKSFRRAMSDVPTSVVVATSMVDETPVGMIVGTFTSVSMDPPLVGFFGDRRSATLEPLLRSERVTFGLLTQDDLDVVEIFQRPLAERFDAVDWTVSDHGTPVIPSALLNLHTRIHSVTDAGDHSCVLAEVVGIDRRDGHHRPMVFYRHRLSRLDPGQILDQEMWQLGWYEEG